MTALKKVAVLSFMTTVQLHIVIQVAWYTLQSLAPDWVLYTIAALYWRVQGDIMNALMCLKNSLVTTPEHLIDVPLVSLASILLKMKEFDNAVAVMHKALAVNNVEVTPLDFLLCVFLLAILW